MFDHETLELIQKTAVEAAGNGLQPPPPGTEPRNVYYVREPDGTLHRKEGVKLDNHKAYAVDTVVRLAAAKTDSALWYARTGVIAAHPDGDRATLSLEISKPLAELAEWDKGGTRAFQQLDLYRALRQKFRDCLGGQFESLMGAIRSVDVKTEAVATGTASRQVVSMGKSVTSEVRGPDLPHTITFYVPVFRDPNVPVTAIVRVGFDLDPQAAAFHLTVLPGEIEAAYAAGEAALLKQIADATEVNECKSIPVYYGTPG